MSGLMNGRPSMGVEGNSHARSTPRTDVTSIMGLSNVFQEVRDGRLKQRRHPCGNCIWHRLITTLVTK